MKRSVVLALIVVMVGLCCASFAATEYVITNDNAIPNTATVYQLDTLTGTLTEFAVLQTGGEGFVESDKTNTQQAITQNAGCIFVMDPTTDDIASFSKAVNYAKVGNYSNPAVALSGSLALTPNGRFLYASYNDSGNVGAWAVNPDCSLSFIAAYVPSFGMASLAALKVSPNGAYLAVSVVGELFAIDQNTGELTDLGFFQNCFNCGAAGGVDFTKDSKIAVFGANFGDQPGAIFAEITPQGFHGVRGWPLLNSQGLLGAIVPFFGAAGYAGSGNLYFGLSNGSGRLPSAVFTSDFVEQSKTVTLTNLTVIDSPPYFYIGPIVATGDLMVIAQYPNQIGVYSINSDGSLSQLSLTTDENAVALFSLSVFPNTR
jgi:hypothetical protein